MTGPPSIDESLAACLYDINVTRSGVVKVSGRCQSFVGRCDIFFRCFSFATTPEPWENRDRRTGRERAHGRGRQVPRRPWKGAPSANTYQAPGVKRAHDFYDVGFRRLSRFGLGSVVGL